MIRLIHIIRLALVLIPAMLTVAHATAQEGRVYIGMTTPLSVEQMPGDSYTWEIYNDPSVDFAVVPGTAVDEGQAMFPSGNNGATVQVTWLEAGVYFYKVTAVDAANCTNNLKIGMIEIFESLPTALITAPEICIGDPVDLAVELTGNAPWIFTLTDGTTSWVHSTDDPNYVITLDPAPKVPTTYWITEIKDLYGTNSDPQSEVTVIVHPKPKSSRIRVVDR